MTLPDLIARLESAPGPSRELDWDIALAVGAVVQRDLGGRTWFSLPGGWHFLGLPKGQPGHFGVKSHDGHRYTSSSDDALTLIPDGEKYRPLKIVLGVSESGKYFEAIVDNWAWGAIVSGHRPNYAIALCIAILRARLAMETGQEKTAAPG